MSDFGYCEGELCSRDGCEGVIELEQVKDCSCHQNAPCWRHQEADMCCTQCGWRAADDPLCVREIVTISMGELPHIETRPRILDPTKVDWVAKLHSSSSMIKEGVFPIGMPIADVEKAVRGTFGGRFERFNEDTGHFKYIAYTD